MTTIQCHRSNHSEPLLDYNENLHGKTSMSFLCSKCLDPMVAFMVEAKVSLQSEDMTLFTDSYTNVLNIAVSGKHGAATGTI